MAWIRVVAVCAPKVHIFVGEVHDGCYLIGGETTSFLSRREGLAP